MANLKSFWILAGWMLVGCNIVACAQTPKETKYDGFILIQQDGPTLGYSPFSGVKIIYEGKFAFKDLNRDGKLDIYEDWRRPIDERVNDLVSQLSKKEMAGLMLHSPGQKIPNRGDIFDHTTYGGKSFVESNANAWDLTDQQLKFLKEDNVRSMLISDVENAEVAAKWNNKAQAYVESFGHGIPNNNSSDPRNVVNNGGDEFRSGMNGKISLWPDEIGIGATFDPEVAREYGQVVSSELRALGVATSLSPQIDLGTEPRWYRFHGTYSEDPKLVTDMAEAVCDGFQTSTGNDALYGAWGMKSINAMAKHWPGGGPCEGGRDAHYGRGKYAVYPGGNYALQKMPYEQGAFRLKSGTKCCSAIMPYYTISHGQSNEEVANNFNYDIVTRQLREQDGFDGVVCTDWGVTHPEAHAGLHSGKPFGVEFMTDAQRHLKVMRASVDQFGGNNDIKPVMEAINMMEKEDGEAKTMERLRASARRLLRNIFRTGLMENPYLIPEESQKLVGCPEYMKKGYEAQVKSVVMVKNHDNVLPLKNAKQTRVYIPKRFYPKNLGFWNNPIPADTITPISREQAEKYFSVVDRPEDADVALVFIDSPNSGFGHSLKEAFADGFEKSKPYVLEFFKENDLPLPEGREDEALHQYLQNIIDASDIYFIPDSSKVACPGNGYYPISLQYNDYVADYARSESVGQGGPFEKIANRSYKGKGVRTYNKCDMLLVQQMRKEMGNKKVIVVANTAMPFVMSEIEPYADAILVNFVIQKQAILDIINGTYEPSGLLPFQMPANMRTVEEQSEDTPRDMQCYKDSEGNTYDFAFGMNWKGVINDQRVKMYR